jgi:hypothetical protein
MADNNLPANRRSELVEFLDHIKGMDPTQMKLALDQFERLLLLRAESDFADSMSAVQNEIQQVIKMTPNSALAGIKYADIGAVDAELRPIYSKHGFSVSFTEHIDPRPEFMHWSCTVKKGAWKETVDMYPRRDPAIKGMRTWIQEAGSVSTYMRRYLLALAFNIVSAFEIKADNDGNKILPPKKPPPKHVPQTSEEVHTKTEEPPPHNGEDPGEADWTLEPDDEDLPTDPPDYTPQQPRQRQARSDVKWQKAKFPGKDQNGRRFQPGDVGIYYPMQKTWIMGEDADKTAAAENLPTREEWVREEANRNG